MLCPVAFPEVFLQTKQVAGLVHVASFHECPFSQGSLVTVEFELVELDTVALESLGLDEAELEPDGLEDSELFAVLFIDDVLYNSSWVDA